jgi:hypothetical protein
MGMPIRGRTTLQIARGEAAPARAKSRHLEAIEQRLFVKRVRLDPRTKDLLFCAVPNGGKRGAREAALMKAEGVERGVPDLMFYEPSAAAHPDYLMAGELRPYVGLALEFKSPDGSGRVTPEQKRWHDGLRVNGWQVAIVTTARDAWGILAVYIGFAP